MASLSEVEVGGPEPEYSNYGFAVLGQAIAEATGQDYSDLVRDRLTEPLGMEETFVPESADGLSPPGSRPPGCLRHRGLSAARHRRRDPLDDP